MSALGIFIGGMVAGAFWHGAFAHRKARKEAEVLVYLAEHGPSYALQMVNAKVGHRGTIYVRLARMEEQGLISSYQEKGGPERGYIPRRVYRLTEKGRTILAAEVATWGPR